MKILITGATGCLGRNLANKLLRDGEHQIYATARNQKIGKILENQGAIFQSVDLKNREKIINLCQNKDIVFHCGALSSPWGKYRDFYETNVLGTQNIIDGCLQHNVKRLVYVSTPSIYFDFFPKYQITESNILPKPVNNYASTKLIAEKIIDQAFTNYKLPVITIRPRAIFGAFDTTIMPRIINVAKKGKLPLINDGKALIDVSYVENVVDSLILCAEASNNFLGKKYNITNDQPIILKELLEKSFAALDLDFTPKIISYKKALGVATFLELIASLPFVKSEPLLTRYAVGVFGISQTLNIEAAKKDLGYRPKIDIDQGIQLYAKWWKGENIA
jgi:nucleoside-diphosphate-sugar epimerase